jgi:hypothetical protein
MGWISGFGPKVLSEIVLEEPILNHRLFLSAKEVLSCVKQLRRSSSRVIIDVVFSTERERSTLECGSHRICRKDIPL